MVLKKWRQNEIQGRLALSESGPSDSKGGIGGPPFQIAMPNIALFTTEKPFF